MNEETLLSIAVSDLLMLIVRPDKQDFQGTAVAVELARKLNVPKMLLVVNKVPPGTNTQELREKIQTMYQAEVAAVLPLNTKWCGWPAAKFSPTAFPIIRSARNCRAW